MIEILNARNKVEESVITKAVGGLDTFAKNWCMDQEETKKCDSPVFRCSKCVFNKEDQCLIKKFVATEDHDYPINEFGPMSGNPGTLVEDPAYKQYREFIEKRFFGKG